jgi:SAM-dependent methyltransferase
MFFATRIISIKEGDKVLEIGPGATPHPLATIFLEKTFASEEELIAQSGHVGLLTTEKEMVFYKGDVFPFEDKSFDYVICSHVLEHVEDVPKFLSEIFRVGKAGYLEFPTIYYDYVHNIEEHLNMLLYKDEKIHWCKKTETPISSLVSFTNFFRELQHKDFRYRQQDVVNSLWHQGFEWFGEIENIQVQDWKELTYSKEELSQSVPKQELYSSGQNLLGIKASFKSLITAIIRKFKSTK